MPRAITIARIGMSNRARFGRPDPPAGFEAAGWQPVFPQGAASPFAAAATVKLAAQQVLVLKKKPT